MRAKMLKTLKTIAEQKMNFNIERGPKSFYAIEVARDCLKETDPIEYLISLCQKEISFRETMPVWGNLYGIAALSIASKLGISMDTNQ